MHARTAATCLTISLLAIGLTAIAQQPPSSAGVGNTGAPGAKHPHRDLDPSQLAQRLLEKFDANKDGELDQAELTQAIEFLRAHRLHGHNDGVSSNATASAGAPAAAASHHRTPPPAELVAQRQIKRFSADGKGLTQAELAQMIEARRARHQQRQDVGQSSGSTRAN